MISIKKNMIPGLGRTGFGRDEIYPDLPRMGSIIVSLIDQGTIQSRQGQTTTTTTTWYPIGSQVSKHNSNKNSNNSLGCFIFISN
jgi:hypothetical protein